MLSFVLSKETVLLIHEGSAKSLLTLKCGVIVFLSYVTVLFILRTGGKLFCPENILLSSRGCDSKEFHCIHWLLFQVFLEFLSA